METSKRLEEGANMALMRITKIGQKSTLSVADFKEVSAFMPLVSNWTKHCGTEGGNRATTVLMGKCLTSNPKEFKEFCRLSGLIVPKSLPLEK